MSNTSKANSKKSNENEVEAALNDLEGINDDVSKVKRSNSAGSITNKRVEGVIADFDAEDELPKKKKLRTEDAGKAAIEQAAKTTLKQKWEKLFTVGRDVVDCEEKKFKIDYDKGDDDEDEKKSTGVLMQAPVKAKDIYTERNIGFDASAFFFDFLDQTLQKRIVADYGDMWKAAMAVTPTDNNYEDPYALATMLLGQPRKMGEINKKENETLLEKLKKILPKFDTGNWVGSLDAFKLNFLIHEWKWDLPTGTVDPAKYIINRFDFSGDGRLNAREFTIANLVTNRKILGTDQCQHCFAKVIKELIDPIFQFADCDSDGVVSAEELWKGLTLLKRDDKFSYYKCIIDKSYFRTSAVNDFVIKAGLLKSGKVTLDEFRLGILLGYWTRHVAEASIVSDDSKNRKSTRWPSGKDTGCEAIERSIMEAKVRERLHKQKLQKEKKDDEKSKEKDYFED